MREKHPADNTGLSTHWSIPDVAVMRTPASQTNGFGLPTNGGLPLAR